MGVEQRAIPQPGAAPLVVPNAAALFRRNATDPALRDRPALKFADREWTHREFYEESCRFANLFRERLDPDRPQHVAVLMDNTPDYLFAFGGAALVGAAVVGLNHTRRGEHLLRDARHTDCQIVLTEPRHEALFESFAADLPPVLTSTRFATDEEPEPAVGELLDTAIAAQPTSDPGLEPDVDTPWALLFTSGTSSAPKAVICSQRRLLVTGNRLVIVMDTGPADVMYVCMPLFHSNAVQVGFGSTMVAGAAVGLARRFSVSRWLDDVRRFGATRWSYTGKPLAYLLSSPEKPDDADNPLALAFGNEGSPEVVEAFARRFGVEVIDSYGATEGGVAVNRGAHDRPGALGIAPDTVKVLDDEGNEKPPARLDAAGRVLNPDECVGEIVNTAGIGPFEGYYNNPEATERTTRFGWYWTGDLGYKDGDGYLYFAGRDADWIRVDGENFTAAPIEEALRRYPGVVLSAVYGVPDDQAGDQVMAGLVLADEVEFDPAGFARWLDAQESIGPKWRPRYVRILREPPTTGTFKIVKRSLVTDKWRSDRIGGDEVWVRGRDDASYRRFTADDERALYDSFVHYQRERFWDL
jgi:fatty-acyl-CoA synthase